MSTPTERRRHRQGALLVDVHATCTSAPVADYTIGVWYAPDPDDDRTGEEIETVTIPAGSYWSEVRSLDGQEMRPFASEVWLVLPSGTRPAGLCVVVGCDRPTR